MSAILGIFARDGHVPADAVVRRMLDRMRRRGAAQPELRRDAHSVMAVARHAWEFADGLSGPVSVVEHDDVVVVADASLYYRDDLRRKLRDKGVSPVGSSPSHFILAAYQAWGESCAEHLEGDFAFVLWDRRARRAVCARDFNGTRSLYFAEVGDTLVVASTLGAVLEYPGCPDDLNLGVIAATAAELFGVADETCYQAVRTVPGGWHLVREAGATARLRRDWDVPPICSSFGDPGSSLNEGAEALRELLCRAVVERLPPDGAASVWMSGGYDSTAIFASGQHVLRDRGESDRLRIVSISYPPGDPGREDELITAIAEYWASPVNWIDIADIPFMSASPIEAAAARDEPFEHLFGEWNRSLLKASRSVGTRIALQGNGGDQLFGVSQVNLADLLVQGRWITLARQWRATRLRGYYEFFSFAVRPLLPARVRHAAGLVRGGRPVSGFLEREVPSWVDERFAERHGLREQRWRGVARRRADGAAGSEMYWMLSYPLFPRTSARLFEIGLEEGVEFRQPLLDARVIAFAASRPSWERGAGRESKFLLRRAMQGLLPDHVLAPRRVRTGTVQTYFDTGMRETHRTLFELAFTRPLLAELGIADADALRKSWESFLRNENDQPGRTLYGAAQTELWLRARLRGQGTPYGEAADVRGTAVAPCVE